MSQKRSLVQEIYKDYTPKVNVRKNIQILLEYVPLEDLAHLESIVLTNTAALSRRRKRHRASSSAPISRILGRYFQRGKGQPAYIEIFVDNILEDVSWFELRIPMLRNWMFAEVLYHEIGHHVQYMSKSNLIQKEAFAEKHADHLKNRLVKYRYKNYRLWLKAIYWLLKKMIALVKLIVRRSGVKIEQEKGDSRM